MDNCTMPWNDCEDCPRYADDCDGRGKRIVIAGETTYNEFRHLAAEFHEKDALYRFTGLTITDEPTAESVKYEAVFRRAENVL